ncbi:MAG TPA: hypothetical protein VJB82_02620 [Candidatus Peribacterales bacterium]|nr:hypothetical protein [Candidatus Peribacterales bacterium]
MVNRIDTHQQLAPRRGVQISTGNKIITGIAGTVALGIAFLYQYAERNHRREWIEHNKDRVEEIYRMSIADLEENIREEQQKEPEERDTKTLKILQIMLDAKRQIERP